MNISCNIPSSKVLVLVKCLDAQLATDNAGILLGKAAIADGHPLRSGCIEEFQVSVIGARSALAIATQSNIAIPFLSLTDQADGSG